MSTILAVNPTKNSDKFVTHTSRAAIVDWQKDPTVTSIEYFSKPVQGISSAGEPGLG